MKTYKKLAVFGGTFSPVHNGHLRAMRVYTKTLQPDVLYVIPTSIPPHKRRQDTASDEDRMEMLRLALAEQTFCCPVVLSDMEYRRAGKSYTVDTVEALLPLADEIFFYCGTDMLLTLEEWHEFKRLLSMATVVYMEREDDGRYQNEVAAKADELREKYGAKLIALPAVAVEISSCEIRERIQEGESALAVLPKRVAAYIQEKGLYR